MMWIDDCTYRLLRLPSSPPGRSLVTLRAIFTTVFLIIAFAGTTVVAFDDPAKEKDQQAKVQNAEGADTAKPASKPDSASAAKPSADPAKPTKPKPEAKPAKPEKTDPNKKSANKPASKGTGDFGAEREQVALDFATQHHPELAKLIAPLKSSNPKEYQHAIRELFRTSERLTGIKTKDSARYDLELEAWKVQSVIRLLTARLTMSNDPAIEAELRIALKHKAENRLRLLQNEQTALQSRMDQIKDQINKATTQSSDEFVQQEYDRLTKRIGRDKAVAPRTNPTKPAVAKPTKPTKEAKE